MTQDEKIEKLAKWMGWKRTNGDKSTPMGLSIKEGFMWNPLTNISDAWMLAEKMRDYVAKDMELSALFYDQLTELLLLTAPDAAHAISAAVLEVIE